MNPIYLITNLFLLSNLTVIVLAQNIDLPFEHLPFYFKNSEKIAQKCQEDPSCPYRVHLNKDVCWGYETGCEIGKKSYSYPICNGHHNGWVQNKEKQIESFYKQADFGYVKYARNSLDSLCEPKTLEDSSLECSEHLIFCRGRNIMIDFTSLPKRTKPVMYDTDVLSPGQIGGFCKLDKDRIRGLKEGQGALQNWSPEVRNFVRLEQRIDPSLKPKICDVVVTRPTFIMKLDATVNMYHHFCDFLNLYASLHVNSSENGPNPFTTDVNILIWRTFPYNSNFEPAFRVFTQHPLQNLDTYSGKKVCFKNLVLPLLPRMIYGLYYNTPLIPGCEKSGLFHAFNRFILHRLRVDQRQAPIANKIKVTILSRDTPYRKALNEDKLYAKLKSNKNYLVKKAKFHWHFDFVEQLQLIQNTDILIGIHGAGLTHLLFLPDWAVVFELYNCGDENCYKDLARIRGLKYLTWRNSSLLVPVENKEEPFVDDRPGPHEKHQNYIFDQEEFAKIVEEGAEHVQNEARKLNQKYHDEL